MQQTENRRNSFCFFRARDLGRGGEIGADEGSVGGGIGYYFSISTLEWENAFGFRRKKTLDPRKMKWRKGREG